MTATKKTKPANKPTKATKGGTKPQAKGKSKANPKKPATPDTLETKAPTEPKEKKTSALDAAVLVLKGAGEPLSTGEIIAKMQEQGLWTSPTGKTPQNTLHAALSAEIKKKGEASRFRKAERGKFALAK